MAIRAPFLYVGKKSSGIHRSYTTEDIKRYTTPSEFVLVPGKFSGYFSSFETGCKAVYSEIDNLAVIMAKQAKVIYDTPYSNASVNHKYKVWIGTPYFEDHNAPIWKNVSLSSAMNNIKDATIYYINKVKTEINNISPANSKRFDEIVAGFYMTAEDVGEGLFDTNLNSHPVFNMFKSVGEHVRSSGISPSGYSKRFMWSPIYSIDKMVNSIAIIVHKSSVFDVVLIQPRVYFDASYSTGRERIYNSVAKQRIYNNNDKIPYNTAPPRATVGVQMEIDKKYFTTLIFYSMGYKLFTLRQASRRSWRINQTAPKVEVYMLYYKDTLQQKAMRLMASKLAVAGIIEGNFTEEGLAAMSDVQDMTSQMAKELMLGIKDNVEDIASSFKKMSIINHDRHMPKEEPAPATPVRTEMSEIAPVVQPRRSMSHEDVAQLAAILEQVKPRKARKVAVNEDQLSIFDFVA